MVHRHECLCSASQLWLPHPALRVVLPECFRGLRIWSGAVGSKSGKLRNVADRDRDLEVGHTTDQYPTYSCHAFIKLNSNTINTITFAVVLVQELSLLIENYIK